jgi:hypothetical protein
VSFTSCKCAATRRVITPEALLFSFFQTARAVLYAAQVVTYAVSSSSSGCSADLPLTPVGTVEDGYEFVKRRHIYLEKQVRKLIVDDDINGKFRRLR